MKTALIDAKVFLSGEENDCLTTLNPGFYQRAVLGGNLSLVPHLWENWSQFYQPQPIAGHELLGTLDQAAFVLRIPYSWNGRLVSVATPATRNQFSMDLVFSDFLLAKGYAYIASDKGTPGQLVDDDPIAAIKNALLEPDAMLRWHAVYHDLTKWAQAYLTANFLTEQQAIANEQQLRCAVPTYALGLSNGGYVVRRALESDNPSAPIFVGGLDVEGVYWQKNDNLISTMRDYIVGFNDYLSVSETQQQDIKQQLIHQGLPECPPSIWRYYYEYYWSAVFNIYRDYFDRDYAHKLPWQQYIQFDEQGQRLKHHDGAVRDYSWSERRQAIDFPTSLMNTGSISVPLISLFGRWDCLTVPKLHGEAYHALVKAAGRGQQHRLYWVDKGTHVDSLVHSDWDANKEIKAMQPYAQGCFLRLVEWVENKVAPPQEQLF